MSVSHSTAVKRSAIVRTDVPLKSRLHFPRTFEDRADLGMRELRAPATFEEYLKLSLDCDFQLHYRDGHIISFIEIDAKTNTIMGEASVSHEALVARIIRALSELLEDSDPNIHILGSNAKIFIGPERRGYNADVTVVKGEIKQQSYKYNRRSVSGITNPWLIVEVLSVSTRDFDLSEKLSDYKQIPSLQQIIFIEQSAVHVSTYIRVSENEWRNLDFHKPEALLPIGAKSISLRSIYQNIPDGPEVR
ncbi:MAG: Uma2 family endonuclease [Saprospiraceae bacterium]